MKKILLILVLGLVSCGYNSDSAIKKYYFVCENNGGLNHISGVFEKDITCNNGAEFSQAAAISVWNQTHKVAKPVSQ